MSEEITYGKLSWPLKVSVIAGWLIIARIIVGLLALLYLVLVGG